MFNILRILYHKIQFHVEFSADQLQERKREREMKKERDGELVKAYIFPFNIKILRVIYKTDDSKGGN